MIDITVLIALFVVMAVSPRAFVFVTVVLGTVLLSKFQLVFSIGELDGNMLRNIATNIAGGFHILGGFVQGKRFEIPRLVRPYLYLVLLAFIALPLSIDLIEGLRFISILSIPIMVLLVSTMFFRERDFIGVYKSILMIAAIQLLAGTIEYAFFPEERVSGLHDVPAVYGWFLCFALVVGAYLVSRRIMQLPVLLSIFVWSSAMIVLTRARIVLLMFPVVLWYFAKELKQTRLTIMTFACVAIFVGSFVLLLEVNLGTARVGVELDESQFELVGEAGGTIAWRLLLWERLLSEWSKNPIVGYGPGADFAVSMSGGVTEDLNYDERESLNTHNEYIKLLYNHGLIGLGLFLAFGYRLLRSMNSSLTSDAKSLTRLVGVSTVMWFLFSLTDNGLSYHGVTSLIFLSIAFQSSSLRLGSSNK